MSNYRNIFRIKSREINQVKQHASTNSYKKNVHLMKKQVKFKNSEDGTLEISPREIVLTEKEKVFKTEVYQVLYLVDRNETFTS